MSKNTPESHDGPAKVTIGTNHYFLGHVKDGIFYIDDEVADGQSHRALTHSRAPYKPKSLEDIQKNGDKIEYLK